MSTGTRPVPVPDERSAPFWSAAATHALALARCSRCGALSHPPGLSCAHCGSMDPGYTYDPVDGSGVIRSWTVMLQSFLPGFDVPFVLVDVELDVQKELRLIGRLVDGPEAGFSRGTPVAMVFEDIADDISVPAFTLVVP